MCAEGNKYELLLFSLHKEYAKYVLNKTPEFEIIQKGLIGKKIKLEAKIGGNEGRKSLIKTLSNELTR